MLRRSWLHPDYRARFLSPTCPTIRRFVVDYVNFASPRMQQPIQDEDANPYHQTEEIDAKDFQRTVFLKPVLACRRQRQVAGHNKETEITTERAMGEGVSASAKSPSSENGVDH